jgi:hypothetical protein
MGGVRPVVLHHVADYNLMAWSKKKYCSLGHCCVFLQGCLEPLPLNPNPYQKLLEFPQVILSGSLAWKLLGLSATVSSSDNRLEFLLNTHTKTVSNQP